MLDCEGAKALGPQRAAPFTFQGGNKVQRHGAAHRPEGCDSARKAWCDFHRPLLHSGRSFDLKDKLGGEPGDSGGQITTSPQAEKCGGQQCGEPWV